MFGGDAAAVRATVKKMLAAIDDAENVDGDTDYLRIVVEENALRDAAIAAFAPLAVTPQDRALLARLQGDAATAREEWPGALAAYARALDAIRTIPTLLSGYAEALRETGDVARAADEYAKLAEVDPSVENYVSLGVTDGDAKRFDDGAVAFAQAIGRARAAVTPSRPTPRRSASWLGRTCTKAVCSSKRTPRPKHARRSRKLRRGRGSCPRRTRATRSTSRRHKKRPSRSTPCSLTVRRRSRSRRGRSRSTRFGRQHVQVPSGRRGDARQDGCVVNERFAQALGGVVLQRPPVCTVPDHGVAPRIGRESHRVPSHPAGAGGDAADRARRGRRRERQRPRRRFSLSATGVRRLARRNFGWPGRYGRASEAEATTDEVIGKVGRVTGAIGPGRVGEIMLAVRGGSEHFNAYSSDARSIAVGTRVVVIEYHPPRTVIVAEA